MLRTLILFLLSLCFSSVLPAQPDETNSTPNFFFQKPVEWYFKTLAGNARLYNGSEYVTRDPNIAGFPFFGSDTMQKATIDYDGIVYHNIPIWYDLVSDDVIIEDYHRKYYITLVKEKVNRFLINDHEFLRLAPDSSDLSVERGFYERIYKGNVSAFAKRTKGIGYTTGSEKVNYAYSAKNSFFILKDDGWFRINSKSSLIEPCGSKANDLRQFYRVNHLNFKKDPERVLLKVVAYYDQQKK